MNFTLDEIKIKEILHEIIDESKIELDQITIEMSADHPRKNFTKFYLYGLRKGGILEVKILGNMFPEKLQRLLPTEKNDG